jgi:hypothetical protein
MRKLVGDFQQLRFFPCRMLDGLFDDVGPDILHFPLAPARLSDGQVAGQLIQRPSK